MKKQISLLLLAAAVLSGIAATIAYAAKATPLIATWLIDPTGDPAGVSHDGTATYEHKKVYFPGAAAVQCYFAVNGRDVDLVTYKTKRTLRFVFQPDESAVWGSDGAGLDQKFNAEVDLFGINYFGPYQKMESGNTAQVQMDLEFHFPPTGNPETYELSYGALAAKRLNADTWLITSDPADICSGAADPTGCAGFTISDAAQLNSIRRRTTNNYGTVHMPIRFEVKLK